MPLRVVVVGFLAFLFTSNVFSEIHSDKDGIPDSKDQCNKTPPKAIVWKEGPHRGCSGGEKKDGVAGISPFAYTHKQSWLDRNPDYRNFAKDYDGAEPPKPDFFGRWFLIRTGSARTVNRPGVRTKVQGLNFSMVKEGNRGAFYLLHLLAQPEEEKPDPPEKFAKNLRVIRDCFLPIYRSDISWPNEVRTLQPLPHYYRDQWAVVHSRVEHYYRLKTEQNRQTLMEVLVCREPAGCLSEDVAFGEISTFITYDLGALESLEAVKLADGRADCPGSWMTPNQLANFHRSRGMRSRLTDATPLRINDPNVPQWYLKETDFPTKLGGGPLPSWYYHKAETPPRLGDSPLLPWWYFYEPDVPTRLDAIPVQ